MFRVLVLIACLIPSAALAQSVMTHSMAHEGGMTMPMSASASAASGIQPIQPGNGAFAAIQEIVGLLMADPKTDWSKVDIDALRQHLVDMDNVTLMANVSRTPLGDAIRFDVTGEEGPVRDSIGRMVFAHAATMNGFDGWTFDAKAIEGGAALTVHAPAKDADKLKGLGFFGVMTLGMHHQLHHLMIARGMSPHE